MTLLSEVTAGLGCECSVEALGFRVGMDDVYFHVCSRESFADGSKRTVHTQPISCRADSRRSPANSGQTGAFRLAANYLR
ncbi:hypothetical protein METHP14_50018 [Pseudomonas sp. P14-2025]